MLLDMPRSAVAANASSSPTAINTLILVSKRHTHNTDGLNQAQLNRIPGMVAYMRPFSVPATAGTLASTYVRGGMVCL